MTKPLVLLTVGATVIVLLVFKAIKEIRKSSTAHGFAVVGRRRCERAGRIVRFRSKSIDRLIDRPGSGWSIHHRNHRRAVALSGSSPSPEFLGKATAEAKAHLESGKEGHTDSRRDIICC